MSYKGVKRKGGLWRDALILLAITLVLGLILGWVFTATRKPIDEAAEAAKKIAYQNVFSQYELIMLEEDENLTSVIDQSEFEDAKITEGVRIVAETGELLGYAFIAASNGYNGEVSISVGVDLEGKVTGVDVVSMNETAGLGANCTKDDFKKQFIGMENSIDCEEIDGLTGATITTQAVTNAINACLSIAGHVIP